MAESKARSWARRWMLAARQASRPVALLFTGTALAQLIPLLASVLLARLYTPNDYGGYAWSLSIVALTALLASGAFSQAINLPQDPREATNLAWLVAFGGALVALALCITSLFEILAFHHLAHRMWFVPAATLLLCIQNAASSIASRNARFAVIVRSRIALAAAGVTTSLLGGWLHIGEAGLMLGNLAGMLAACLVFLAGRQPACSSAVRRPSFKELQTTVRRFSEFPRWQLPAAFIDVVATQSPVWFISSYFGIDVLGQYSFAGRVLGTPLQLLGASFGEVFRQQASAEWRRLGRCRETVGHYGFVLGSIFLPIVVLLAILGPRLVVAVFGARWLLAGEFVRYLALLYALRGSVGTLSYVLILGGRQRSVFVVHLLFLTCSGCALAAAAAGFGPVATIAVLIGSNAWVYLAYARIIAQTSSGGGATTITPGTDANSR